jgi:hypothetical protein
MLQAHGNNPAATVYHEAAHAVVAVLLEPLLRLRLVRIHPGGQTGDFSFGVQPTPAGLNARAVALAAGEQGEILAGQEPDQAREGARDDLRQLEAILDEMGVESAVDALEHLERWGARASGMLVLNWGAVAEVAALLGRCGSLRGDQVRAIVKAPVSRPGTPRRGR